MRARSGRWWQLASAAGLLALLVMSTHSLLAAGTRGAEIANVYALPMAALLVLASVVLGVLALRQADRGGHGEQLVGEARRLAAAVRKREQAALARLVGDTGDAQPAELGFTQPELIYWRTDGGEHSGSLSQIEDYYRELRRGRLVMLGPAGSGKTVLAIRLVLAGQSGTDLQLDKLWSAAGDRAPATEPPRYSPQRRLSPCSFSGSKT